MKHAFYFSSRIGLMWAWRGVGGGLGVLIRALEVEWVQSYKTEIIRVEGKGALRNRGPWFHSFFSLSMFFNTFCGAVALLRGGGECSTKNQPFLGNVPSHGPASRDHGAQNFSESVSLPRKLKRTLRNETHTHRSTASYFVRENLSLTNIVQS